jgi:hypothetical protein
VIPGFPSPAAHGAKDEKLGLRIDTWMRNGGAALQKILAQEYLLVDRYETSNLGSYIGRKHHPSLERKKERKKDQTNPCLPGETPSVVASSLRNIHIFVPSGCRTGDAPHEI